MAEVITATTIKPKPTGWFRKWLNRPGTAFFGFISLWLAGIILLQIFPLTTALVLSFTNFNGFNLEAASFIGWSNYAEAFKSPDAWFSMGQTLLYCFLSIPLSILLALGLAILLNQKMAGRGIYRTAFYLPTMVPIGATALIFKAILDSNTGFLNLFISIFRPGTVINWITDYGIFCLALMSIWACGARMVIFLAGLQGIPEEYHEAAMIDGANKWQVFRHVTWPLLTPITYFQCMLAIIEGLQMFIQAAVLNQSRETTTIWNPSHSLLVYPGYALQQMMSSQRFGYGLALIWILFIIVLIISLTISKTSKYWVYYAVEQEGGAKKNE